MAESNGKVKPKRAGARALRRLQWLRDHSDGDWGFSDCMINRYSSKVVAQFLEEIAELVRIDVICVTAVMLHVRNDQPVMPGLYAEYLRSPEWQQRRFQALHEAGDRCQVCNSDGDLEVHHRTYERIGREELGDLIVLCRACHQLFHDNGKLARPDGR